MVITETSSDAQLLGLAIERNVTHGLQMSQEDKRRMARQLYTAKTHKRDELQRLLSVSTGTLSNWLADIEKADREERKRKIQDLWLSAYDKDEIAKKIAMSKQPVEDALSDFSSELKKNPKVQFLEEGFTSPLYNVWTFAKKTNEVTHFGNSEQRIVDNLLYLYTEPFDIVIDPFAGGGSTLDVCKKWLRLSPLDGTQEG